VALLEVATHQVLAFILARHLVRPLFLRLGSFRWVSGIVRSAFSLHVKDSEFSRATGVDHFPYGSVAAILSPQKSRLR
jgi:hypothetical protein